MKYSCAQENIIESSKSYGQKKMNKKLKITIKFVDNVACKYPDTKIYIEENLNTFGGVFRAQANICDGAFVAKIVSR